MDGTIFNHALSHHKTFLTDPHCEMGPKQAWEGWKIHQRKRLLGTNPLRVELCPFTVAGTHSLANQMMSLRILFPLSATTIFFLIFGGFNMFQPIPRIWSDLACAGFAIPGKDGQIIVKSTSLSCVVAQTSSMTYPTIVLNACLGCLIPMSIASHLGCFRVQLLLAYIYILYDSIYIYS